MNVANGKTATKPITNGASSTPLSEVTFNGTTIESTQTNQSNHQFSGFGLSDHAWGPPQSASHRRRRPGVGKSNPAMRTTVSRPSGFNAAKSYASTASTESPTNTNSSSGPLLAKKPASIGSRSAISSSSGLATSTATITGSTTGVTPPVTTTYSDSNSGTVFSQSKSAQPNTSPSYTLTRGGRGGRSQQPYLLSTPPSHAPCGNPMDYANSNTTLSYAQSPPSNTTGLTEYAKTLPPAPGGGGGGALMRDRSHLVWESEMEREAIQSVLSAIPAPQVSWAPIYDVVVALLIDSILSILKWYACRFYSYSVDVWSIIRVVNR
ncbi:unnamed protein product [Echinostoma caproni]|uniref:Flocculation protein FLO11-like n=1 Tax=Echinostoma caproni TaxID=27848 RepID=A0A183B0I3_9TREM|nr:unnamed protein product [Echinostoma caproni]